MVAVTGVSGSGKSTLIENVLYGTYQRSRGVVDVDPGEVGSLEGLEGLEDVTLVDQRPLGRSSRSNPVTYIKAYDEIRKLFAATADAKVRRITSAHFSFNMEHGRCPTCQGTGVTEVDMQFMAPVTVVCETCQGHRFQPEVLAVRYHGKNISEVLDLTIETALEFFADQKRLSKRLRMLLDVGLGYLRLGQPTSTLSGGEAQRLKLASFLDRPGGGGEAPLPLRRAHDRPASRGHRPPLPHPPPARAAGRRRGGGGAQPGPDRPLRLDSSTSAPAAASTAARSSTRVPWKASWTMARAPRRRSCGGICGGAEAAGTTAPPG